MQWLDMAVVAVSVFNEDEVMKYFNGIARRVYEREEMGVE